MSISVDNIENPDSLFLIKIADTFNIKEIKLSYYESIFTIHLDNMLIGVINYVFIPSMRKNRIYIRNIHYNNTKYLDIIIKELIKFFKNYMIETSTDTDPINKVCEEILRKNNFKGDKVIFYE